MAKVKNLSETKVDFQKVYKRLISDYDLHYILIRIEHITAIKSGLQISEKIITVSVI